MAIVTQALYTTLWCDRCSDDTIHAVLYVGPQIKEIRCTSCHTRLVLPTRALRQGYMHGLPHRARVLASDAFHSFHRRPTQFVTHLPKYVMLKALELSAELYAVLAARSEDATEPPDTL